MIEVVIAIGPLFLIILLGAILAKLKVADSWSEVLNTYALKVGFPALIFSALSGANLQLSNQLPLILANSLLLIGIFIIAYLAGLGMRLSSKNFRTLFICLGFGNVAYLGIPTLTQIFGQEVLPIVSFIVAIYLFWFFTVGIGFLEYSESGHRRGALKKVVISLIENPILIAVVLGLIIGGLSLPIPSMINKAIAMIAGSVTPVVLIVIGLFIGKSKFGTFKKWLPAFAFTAMTLVVLPAFFYFGILLFGLSPDQLSSSILEAAMPLAITPFALADAYGLNKSLIARSIVLSTILSVITIPFWSSIL
jgi:hypothetical protein